MVTTTTTCIGGSSSSSSNLRCWRQRDFVKDKLRVRERYWHSIDKIQQCDTFLSPSSPHHRRWILPDASAWRTYLSLIVYLMDRDHESMIMEQQTSNCCWVVLESVAECMDYRNMSAIINDDGTIHKFPEQTAPQERFKLQKILQHPQYHTKLIIPFCDLSIREQSYSKLQEGNEYEDEWDIMKYKAMTITDRSRHALFRAARLLRDYHIVRPTTSPARAPEEEVWILSGDVDFVRRFPEEDGIRTILISDLLNKEWFGLEATKQHPEQLERLHKFAKRCEDEYAARNTPASSMPIMDTFEHAIQEYWTEDAIQEGLRNKMLFKGCLTVTKDNPKEGVVLVRQNISDHAAAATSFFINQQKGGHFNRSLHQDIVIVRPLPKEQWTSPIGRRRLVPIRNDDNDIVEDENDAMVDDNADPPIPSGTIVGLVQETRRKFVATMVNTPMNDESACLVVPMDVRIPKIRIKTNAWQRFQGNRLWVQIDGWEVGSSYPSGHCIDILGPIADLEAEITCLLKENQIFLEPFSAAAKASLPPQGHDWQIPDSEISRRRDLRSFPIFSVDPVGCQDIDDSMHARILPNGDVEIGVHIADVTYFVQQHSALDREAQIRATTFYLVDRRFDMLPSVLSSNLCSLHGEMDRLAVSTIWTFSNDLEHVKDFWYGRTVIHNVQAMTYEQAHNILHDLPPDDPSKATPPPFTAGYPVKRSNVTSLKKDLGVLTRLARTLRKKRESIGGAVDLSSGDQGNELKFSLDDQGNPVRVTPKKQLEVHHTIAELMILANTFVAKTIYERFPDSSLLRIHQKVDESRFDDLKEVLQAGKINFDGTSNMTLADSLKVAESKTNSMVSSLFQSLATRAMSEAQYVSTGEVQGDTGLSHYGLGLDKYTHFTSPIRRYADVVVHRQLLQTLIPVHKTPIAPPPGFGHKVLNPLPESETISVLRGEGIGNSASHESVSNDPIAFASSQTIDSPWTKEENGETEIKRKDQDLYNNAQVSKICESLNKQNRMAKLSSFECQNLFLSLYFKDHVEVTQAVVTSLRANGFFAYVPRFDFRAPVYLSDKNGDLQVDPRLLHMDPLAGLPPTTGFAASNVARRFPAGQCMLKQSTSGEELLQVVIPDASTTYQVRVLDVVTVAVYCDDWNAKSRIPQPRIQLIAPTSRKGTPVGSKVSNHEVESSRSSQLVETRNPSDTSTRVVGRRKQEATLSVYDAISRIETPSILTADVRRRSNVVGTISVGGSIFPGRCVFGGFVNPDTRIARQEVAMQEASEAALERRNQILESRARRAEFETTSRIEKEVTSRMQRLAVNKRNSKIKGKGK